jgi:transcription termination factor Rho
MLYMLGEEERTQLLIEKLDKTETNDQFLDTLKTA